MAPTTQEEWNALSGAERGRLIADDPGLAYRFQPAPGYTEATDPGSPFRFQDPNNLNPYSTYFYTPRDPQPQIEGNPFRRVLDAARNAIVVPQQPADNTPDKTPTYSGPSPMELAMRSLEESYARQMADLDAQRTQASSALEQIYGQTLGNLNRYQGEYQQQAERGAASMESRMAQALAETMGRQQQLQKSVGSIGGNVGALQQQAAGNVEALKAAQGFQRDYSQTSRDIAASGLKDLLSSSALVRQGAVGQLQNNYNYIRAMLQKQLEEGKLNLQMSASSGGGGDSAPSLQDQLDELAAGMTIDALTSQDYSLPSFMRLALAQGKPSDAATILDLMAQSDLNSQAD